MGSGMAVGFGIMWMAGCTGMNSTGKAGRTVTLWNGLRKEMLAKGVYERGRKQGEWVEHVNDDRREGAYVDGDRDGRWIHFDAEGNIVFEGAYVAGIPTGEHVSYWPSGIREWIGSYKGGLRDGNWRYFDGAEASA